jgi:hypothetical protein
LIFAFFSDKPAYLIMQDHDSAVFPRALPPADLASLPTAIHSHRASLAFVVTYILVFLVPVLCFAYPPTDQDIGSAAIFNLLGIYHVFALPLLVVSQFIPQIRLVWSLRHDLEHTVISLWTPFLQFFCFLMVGMSWKIYHAGIGRPYTQPDSLYPGWWEWYCRIGWRWLNYVAFGIGQGVLFMLYVHLKYFYPNPTDLPTKTESNAQLHPADERIPLLG